MQQINQQLLIPCFGFDKWDIFTHSNNAFPIIFNFDWSAKAELVIDEICYEI